jgi:translocation and assembly module TamA
LCLGCLLAVAAQAQPQPPPAASEASKTSAAFTIEVRAPQPVRALIEKYNDFQNYQQIPDLAPAELGHLLAAGVHDVRALLGTQGYFSPGIRLARTSGADGRPRVVIEVEPGAQARVRQVTITFEGAIADDPAAARQRQRIQQSWSLPAGQVFTQDAWSAAKADALRALTARRYPAGKISASRADIDAGAGRASLSVRFDSGPLFKLGPLQVAGAQRYDAQLAARLARLAPGQIYDQQALEQARLRLTGSGYYDSAALFIDPQSATPQAAPVQAQVAEAKLQKVTLGGGYSTDGGARASLQYIHNSVPGLGWRAITGLQLEKADTFVQTDWRGLPFENGWRLGAFAKYERQDDGQLVTTSQQLRYGRSRSDDNRDRNDYLQLDQAQVSTSAGAPLSGARVGDGMALSFNRAWARREFDHLRDPTRGWGLGADLGVGSTLAGPRKPFVRALGRWMQFVPLGDDPASSRLALRAEGGAVIADQAARVPGNLLFRTGGNTTVRGYAYRSIGVDYDGGSVTAPGRYMTVGSIEWQRPIVLDGKLSSFEHIVFLDAGDVAQRAAALRLREGVGTGVRMRTPVGPLELDLAYGLKPHQFRLHLNLGFTW